MSSPKYTSIVKTIIMQIVRSDFHQTKRSSLSSFVRNSSCSRGWLRLVVQTIFGLITVISFILIVHMAYSRPTKRPNVSARCKAYSCRVVCNDAPHFSNYEEDIINTAMEAETNCKRMFLILKNPMFVNSTMPLNWLSAMRSRIRTLSIIGGNLKYIPPYAFMSTFASNVRSLFLEDITLKTWLPETFIGLSNLQELCIKNTKLEEIHSNALKAIDDTIRTLDIEASNIWNPVNITGSADPVQLTTVDFSRNIFFDSLNDKSFSELSNCKILYLNSCKITSIGSGTFDHLVKIEILFLNDNFIHIVPVGLFDVLLALKHKPRINLQDNPWLCKCSIDDLRQLHINEVLIVEPSCYYPKEIRGLTFSEFEDHCSVNNSTQTELVISDANANVSFDMYNRNKILNIHNKLPCNFTGRTTDEYLILISPFSKYKCSGNRVKNYELKPVASKNVNDLFSTDNKWLKPIFYSRNKPNSFIEMAIFGPNSYGLLWYRSNCPREVYCVSKLPKVLRVFNVNENSHYTFCRNYNGTVLNEECVVYDLSKADYTFRNYYFILLCILAAFVCLSCGAVSVYGLIRKHPGLLKGSKRVLFVKHRQVDALVLPPKVPSRSNLQNDSCNSNNNIFIVSHNNNLPLKFGRVNSTRSTNSNPSYISAIQPSEDQLAQWRLKRYLDKDSTIHSLDSNTSTFSWIYDANTVPYQQLDNKEPIYDDVI